MGSSHSKPDKTSILSTPSSDSSVCQPPKMKPKKCLGLPFLKLEEKVDDILDKRMSWEYFSGKDSSIARKESTDLKKPGPSTQSRTKSSNCLSFLNCMKCQKQSDESAVEDCKNQLVTSGQDKEVRDHFINSLRETLKKVELEKKWCVGDHCRAIHHVDGLRHEAKITSIDDTKCTVSFWGYNEDAEVELNSLTKSLGEDFVKEQLLKARIGFIPKNVQNRRCQTSDFAPYADSNPDLGSTFPSFPSDTHINKELCLTVPIPNGDILAPFHLERYQATSSHKVFILEPLLEMDIKRGYNNLDLQLKCFHQEDKLMKTNWPASILVIVNGTPLRTNWGENEKKHRPLSLNHVCKVGVNSILISVDAPCTSHLFSLQVVRQPTISSFMWDLMDEYLPRPYLARNYSFLKRNAFLERFRSILENAASKVENGVELPVVKVSLKCPISSKRISLPVRGLQCEHIQCFDAKSYLELNIKRGDWLCPVCNKPVLPEHLKLDQFIKDIITSDLNVEEISIDSKANWKPVHKESNGKSKEQEKKKSLIYTHGQEDPLNKLLIENLPTFLNEDQVNDFLTSFGELKSFHLARDTVTGLSEGYAFVEYVDAGSADQAIWGLNGMPLSDKRLIVRRAKEKNVLTNVPVQVQFPCLQDKDLLAGISRERKFVLPEEYKNSMTMPTQTSWEIDHGISSSFASAALRMQNLVNNLEDGSSLGGFDFHSSSRDHLDASLSRVSNRQLNRCCQTSDFAPYTDSNPDLWSTFPSFSSDTQKNKERLVIPIPNGDILAPFRLEPNLAVSNHVFILDSLLEMDIKMAYTDLDLQFKCFHHEDKQMKTNWPASIQVTVNGTPLYERVKIHKSKNEKHSPLSLNKVCKLGKNTIQITVDVPCTSHLFLLQVVRQVSITSFMGELLCDNLSRAYFTDYSFLNFNAFLKRFKSVLENAASNVENGGEQPAVKVSLICPISFKRIYLPVRGLQCEHIQCFDAKSYLKLNIKRGDWLCPVCNKPALPEHLELDKFIRGIITSDLSVKEISIDSKANWKPVCKESIGKSKEEKKNNSSMTMPTPTSWEINHGLSPSFASPALHMQNLSNVSVTSGLMMTNNLNHGSSLGGFDFHSSARDHLFGLFSRVPNWQPEKHSNTASQNTSHAILNGNHSTTDALDLSNFNLDPATAINRNGQGDERHNQIDEAN